MGNKISAEQRDIELSDAAEEGKAEKVGSLLKEGANPNRKLSDGKRKSRTSLHQAAKTKNNVNVLTKLLDYVQDVDATDEDGNTPLHLAAGYYNNAAVVQTLLHAGPNCNIQNCHGETPLHSSIKGGSDAKIIESLLLADSDPNISDFDGNTALHLCAAMRGVDAMIPGMLLRFGANPNLKNEEGETTLHVAAKNGNKAVLLLLRFHAKVRLRDNQGRKPCEVAATDEIRNILEWEERELEERTLRVESTMPPISSRVSSRNSYYSDVGNGYPTHHFYTNHNHSSTQIDGRQDYGQDWKGSGGDGVIHLPDKSDIVVPPQAVPYGTKFEVKITPTAQGDSDSSEVPEFDFEMFNFDFDVTVQLPGVLFVAPWMLDSPVTTNFSVNTSSCPAFTGMCIEGRNKWRSLRELASQSDGILALRFKLSKEKSRPISFKGPVPTRRSTAEIELQKTPRDTPVTSNGLTREDSVFSADSQSDIEQEDKIPSSSDDMEIVSDRVVGTDSTTSQSEVSSTSSESVGSVVDKKDDEFPEELVPEDEEQVHRDSDHDKEFQQFSQDTEVEVGFDEEKNEPTDIYAKLDQLPASGEYEYNDDDEDPQLRYDHHPIDPALATIHEETQSNASSDRVQQIVEFYDNPNDDLKLADPAMRADPGHYMTPIESEKPKSPRFPAEYDADIYLKSEENGHGTYESGYDISMDDIDSFAQVTEDARKTEEMQQTSNGRRSSGDVSGSLFF